MFWIVRFLITQPEHEAARIAYPPEWFASFVPLAVASITPFVPPSTVMKLRLSMVRQASHNARLILDPVVNRIVIGLPDDPEPCAVSGDVIVPHSPTTVPGPIALPAPQFDAVLKNETALAFAQLLPSPVPAAVWAR